MICPVEDGSKRGKTGGREINQVPARRERSPCLRTGWSGANGFKLQNHQVLLVDWGGTGVGVGD